MIDISKIREHLPNCEASEVRPCTSPGKIQFHLRADKTSSPTEEIINTDKLYKFVKKSYLFENVKHSPDLKVVKANIGDARLSVLGSGRIVLRRTGDEKRAQEILEELAPLIKDSFFS
jgi:ArsR family metal-binding transcriptional regulator